MIVADRTFAQWNDAGAWEADRKRQVAAGRLASARAGRVPLPDLFTGWSQARPRQVRTWQSHQSAWTTHLARRFGDRPVARITGRDVQAWVRRLGAPGAPQPVPEDSEEGREDPQQQRMPRGAASEM